jgi:amino acid transporter
VDPVLVRVVFAALTLASGVGIIAYIILAIALPEARKTADPLVSGMPDDPVAKDACPTGAPSAEEKERRGAMRERRRMAAGLVLVLVGAVLLASNFNVFFWWRWDVFWPLVIIGVGVFIIAGRQLRGGKR